MKTLDIWTIGIFSMVVFLTGISFAGTGKDIKSFFAAGGAVPWWINGLSLFMSFFSAGTFVVWGSIAYTDGWVAITIQWAMAIAGFLIGFVIAPRWRKTGVITAAEFITTRLGYKTQKIYTYLFLVISMFTTGAFLYPVAKIVEVSTDIPILLCIVVLGLLITIYTAAGGLWAVIVTDVLQFIVLTSAVLIVVPLSFQHVGGVSGFVEQAPEHFFTLINSEYTKGFLLSFCLYNLVFVGGNWAYVQRYTSVANTRNAKKVGWLFGGLYIISPVIWMLPPMIYRIVNPHLQGLSDEGAYLLMCKTVLPGGLLGLILGGMIFATSSSVNTTLNISAGVFTNDIFRHFYPNSSDKSTIRIARLSTVGFGLLTILVALFVPNMGGIVEVVLSVAALTGGALYLPPIWAMFSKRQTARSILSATLISLAVNVFFKFISPFTINVSLTRAEEMGMGVAIPIIVLLFFEFYYAGIKYNDPGFASIFNEKNPNKDPLLQKASDEKNQNDNLRGIRVIGLGITAIGILITLLGLVADFATWLISGIGLTVVLLGIFLLVQSNRIKNLQFKKVSSDHD